MKRIGMIIRNDEGDMDNILTQRKFMETRERNVFKSHIGERFELLTYIDGKLYAVASAIVNEPVYFQKDCSEAFDKLYNLHRVDPESRYHISKSKTGKKYGYMLTCLIEYEKPIPVQSRGCSSVRYVEF